MRIAMLSWESLHSIAVGGVAVHVSELAAALARAGHEVHIFTRRAPNQRYHERLDGVQYHRCSHAGHTDFVEDINNLCRALVERLLVVEDMVGAFDVVHAHDWLAANAMIWARQGREHHTVLTMHSTEYGRCGNAFCNGGSARVRHQERAGTYWADRVICVSHATRKEVAWMYEVPENKTRVIYNGVSPERFRVPLKVDAARRQYDIGPLDPTILFCGRLEWQKGPDLLLESLPPLLGQHAHLKCVVVGEGSMRAALEARARKLGVAHALRVLGHRGGTELASLFMLSDCVCVPSRNEPFGIVVLEAWAAAKPVVASQNGGPAEYVEHEVNGLKVFPRPDSIGWGLRTLFADFERARRMGENGSQTVDRRFNWDMIARETAAVYGEVLPQPASA